MADECVVNTECVVSSQRRTIHVRASARGNALLGKLGSTRQHRKGLSRTQMTGFALGTWMSKVLQGLSLWAELWREQQGRAGAWAGVCSEEASSCLWEVCAHLCRRCTADGAGWAWTAGAMSQRSAHLQSSKRFLSEQPLCCSNLSPDLRHWHCGLQGVAFRPAPLLIKLPAKAAGWQKMVAQGLECFCYL